MGFFNSFKGLFNFFRRENEFIFKNGQQKRSQYIMNSSTWHMIYYKYYENGQKESIIKSKNGVIYEREVYSENGDLLISEKLNITDNVSNKKKLENNDVDLKSKIIDATKKESSSNLNDNGNKLNTSSAQVLFQKGQSARNGKDYKLAIQYYEDAIKIDPNHAGSYFYLGLIYDEVLQKYDLSSEYYSKVIKVDPEPDPVTYYNRGIVYAKLLKYKDAINDFTIAIEKDPTNASAFKNRGVVKQVLGLNSCSDWKKGCELGSKECCSWFERDGCYVELKEKETTKQESSSNLNKLKQKNLKSSSNFMFELDELQALFYNMTQIGLIDGEFSEKEQAFSNSIIEEMPGFNLVSDWKSFVDDAFALKGEDALNILKKMDFQKRVYVMKVLISLIGSDGRFDDKEISALKELKVFLNINDSDLKFNRKTDYLDDKILDLLDQALKYSSKK